MMNLNVSKMMCCCRMLLSRACWDASGESTLGPCWGGVPFAREL